MYEYLDRAVASLERGECFLIWSMRSWVSVMRNGRCAAPALAPAFARWDMIRGLQPFARFMLLLDREALQPLALCKLECRTVAEHEALVLAMVRRCAADDPCRTRDTLALFVREEAVGDTLAALTQVAEAMRQAALLSER